MINKNSLRLKNVSKHVKKKRKRNPKSLVKEARNQNSALKNSALNNAQNLVKKERNRNNVLNNLNRAKKEK